MRCSHVQSRDGGWGAEEVCEAARARHPWAAPGCRVPLADVPAVGMLGASSTALSRAVSSPLRAAQCWAPSRTAPRAAHIAVALSLPAAVPQQGRTGRSPVSCWELCSGAVWGCPGPISHRLSSSAAPVVRLFSQTPGVGTTS